MKLSKSQEAQLTGWILTQEALGFPLTYSQIKEVAQRILYIGGSTELLGHHWIQNFLRRNPNIKTKNRQSMDIRRINRATTEIIQVWFRYLDLPQIREIPATDRYDMDEAGIIEGFGINRLIVGRAGNKKAIVKSSDSRIWTTIFVTMSIQLA
jgi:4-hydroxybenzoate polyprenyltransferase